MHDPSAVTDGDRAMAAEVAAILGDRAARAWAHRVMVWTRGTSVLLIGVETPAGVRHGVSCGRATAAQVAAMFKAWLDERDL